MTSSPSASIAQLSSIGQYAPMLAYIGPSLASGGPLAAAFVAGLIEDAAAYLEAGVASGSVRPSRYPAGRAWMLVAAQPGSLQPAQLEGEAGRGTAPTQDAARALEELSHNLLAGLELYTQGLFTGSSWLDAYLAYVEADPTTDVHDHQESRTP